MRQIAIFKITLSILTLLFLFATAKAEQHALEQQLREVTANKKAQIGIAVILNGKDTIIVNNENRYPMMSVFKPRRVYQYMNE